MNITNKLSYGQYIVTSLKPSEEMSTRGEDYIAAGTMNWVMQSSFEPPMIAMAVRIDSDLQEAIEKSRRFTLHLLMENQGDIAKRFGEDSRITEKTINDIPYVRDENNQIILDGVLGYITCEITDSIRTGDHHIYTAKLINQELLVDGEPLTTRKTEIQYT